MKNLPKNAPGGRDREISRRGRTIVRLLTVTRRPSLWGANRNHQSSG